VQQKSVQKELEIGRKSNKKLPNPLDEWHRVKGSMAITLRLAWSS